MAVTSDVILLLLLGGDAGECCSFRRLFVSSTSLFSTLPLGEIDSLEQSVLFDEVMRESISWTGLCAVSDLLPASTDTISMLALSVSFNREAEVADGLVLSGGELGLSVSCMALCVSSSVDKLLTSLATTES